MNITKAIAFGFVLLQAHEVAKIEVRQEARVSPPQATIASIPGRTIVSHPGRRPEPESGIVMVIQSLKLDSTRAKLSYEIQLHNQSTKEILVPIGRNGKDAASMCPNSDLIAGYVGFRAASAAVSGSSILADFYGCKELKDSTAALEPGDWVTIFGTFMLGEQPTDAKTAHLTFGLDHRHYVDQDGRVMVDSTAIQFTQADHPLD